MSQARTVVLDDEAVEALADPAHHKHRRVLAVVEAAAARNLRRAGAVRLVVPTCVRVEAGWNRRDPGAAVVHRLRIDDVALDTLAADAAAGIRSSLGVSVADATTYTGSPNTSALVRPCWPSELRHVRSATMQEEFGPKIDVRSVFEHDRAVRADLIKRHA